jgi:DNA-binding XRE family transcriptional regulator
MGYKNQQDFGNFLGIGKSNYSLIENNKKQVTLEIALKIAHKLNRPVEDIFKLE